MMIEWLRRRLRNECGDLEPTVGLDGVRLVCGKHPNHDGPHQGRKGGYMVFAFWGTNEQIDNLDPLNN